MSGVLLDTTTAYTKQISYRLSKKCFVEATAQKAVEALAEDPLALEVDLAYPWVGAKNASEHH